MRNHRLRRLTKTQIFGILMLISLSLLLIPSKYLRPVKSITQLVALPQWLARESTQKVTDKIRDMSEKTVPGSTHDGAMRRNQGLAHENASLRQQLAELQATVDAMVRIRKIEGFPEKGVLIPARVMASDAAPGRDSLLIGKGPKDKAKKGAWVASRLFIDAGSEIGVHDELAVLARECLIGWVEEVGPFAARVVLLTDPGANKAMRVRIRPYDEKLRSALMVNGKAVDFTLKGAGPDRMKIADIPREYIENGNIRVADWIISSPNDPNLPIPVAIGQIAELTLVKEKPVYYEALIQPACDAKALRDVFVVDLPDSTQPHKLPAKNR